jgi:hypothetical protein
MQDIPSFGHVVELKTLYKLLSPQHITVLENLLENDDGYDFDRIIVDYLIKVLPQDVCKPSHVFLFNDNHNSYDMTDDVWYAIFDENDLFIMQDTPAYQNMQDKIGDAICFTQWTTWC